MCLALLVAGAGPANAEDAPPAAPPPAVPSPEAPSPEASSPETPSPAVAPSAGSALKREVAAAGTAMDATHNYLERGILARVVWFDDFFGNVRTEDVRQTEYLLRWQNAVRWEEGGRFKFRTNIRANLRLPNISERLHLLVVGESEPERSPGLPEDPGNPGFDRTLPNARLVNTELRYVLLRRPDADLFLGAGVRLVLPFESFVRSRFQCTRHLGETSLARFGETVFWKDTLGFGETTEIGLERQLRPKTVLRWSNSGTVAQRSKGLEWGTELALLQELSPRSAVTLAGGVFGDTRPAIVIETYKIYTRYRRNFLRSWLFFELEPEVAWPRTAVGGYKPAVACTFRIEIVFQGKTAVVSPPRSR